MLGVFALKVSGRASSTVPNDLQSAISSLLTALTWHPLHHHFLAGKWSHIYPTRHGVRVSVHCGSHTWSQLLIPCDEGWVGIPKRAGWHRRPLAVISWNQAGSGKQSLSHSEEQEILSVLQGRMGCEW